MLKAKLRAAIIHGFVTSFLGLLAAVAVFLVWYPQSFAEMSRGAELFLLIIFVEVVLGPVISLVIFNPRKRRSELVRDYCIVGIFQMLAFFYGVHSVFISRPVFLVFVKDRIEVVAAVELSDSDLSRADPKFKSLPILGPKTVCVESPTTPEDKSKLLLSALQGRDIQLLPEYYRECFDGEIASNAYTRDHFVALDALGEAAVPKSLNSEDFTWLPVVTRFGSWLVIFPKGDTSKSFYINLDPFS